LYFVGGQHLATFTEAARKTIRIGADLWLEILRRTMMLGALTLLGGGVERFFAA
jgi:hypothetical protein